MFFILQLGYKFKLKLESNVSAFHKLLTINSWNFGPFWPDRTGVNSLALQASLLTKVFSVLSTNFLLNWGQGLRSASVNTVF